MNKTISVSLLAILLFFARFANGQTPIFFNTSTTTIWPDLKNQIGNDYYQYYRHSGIPYFIGGLSVGSVMANSHFDSGLTQAWQTHIRCDFSNQISNITDDYSAMTQYPISLPLYFASWWLTEQINQFKAINQWGNHCLRTLLLGAPQQAILTNLLGSGRPEYSPSHWQWYQYNRAVSGHAFYGAVPLLNMAKQSRSPWLKPTFYILSTLPALARFNNNNHYASQAFLGWWLAFGAMQTVWESDEVSKKPNHWSMQLYPNGGTIYLGLRKII